MQSLRAKLSTDVRDSEHGPRLKNLKSRLRTAYEIAREQGRRSHATNKRYYDKHAKHREFEVGDTVYFYNPAVKKGVSAKFGRPWVGPWRVTEKKSRLNYAIVDRRGKRLVVHVNRLKRHNGRVDWERADQRQPSRTNRPKRRPTEEEAGYEPLSPGPIEIRGPLVGHPPVERRTPGRGQNMDTPASDFSPPKAPSNHWIDPTYAPSDTTLSRREMETMRDSPPLTRLRSRLHILREEPEEEHDE